MIKALCPAVLLLLAACNGSGGNSDSNVAAQTDPLSARVAALKDSTVSLQEQFDAVCMENDSIKSQFDELLAHFHIVEDPLLVEKYRVVEGWQGYDTTGRQGILSRVLEDGSIEIVVTASADFSTIKLSNGKESVTSDNVPPGNALHTKIGGLTRVAFNRADTLAAFVDSHIDEAVTLQCGTKSFALSDAQKKMIAETYRFTKYEKRLKELDRRKSVLYNKLEVCRIRLDEIERQTTNKQNKAGS